MRKWEGEGGTGKERNREADRGKEIERQERERSRVKYVEDDSQLGKQQWFASQDFLCVLLANAFCNGLF